MATDEGPLRPFVAKLFGNGRQRIRWSRVGTLIALGDKPPGPLNRRTNAGDRLTHDLLAEPRLQVSVHKLDRPADDLLTCHCGFAAGWLVSCASSRLPTHTCLPQSRKVTYHPYQTLTPARRGLASRPRVSLSGASYTRSGDPRICPGPSPRDGDHPTLALASAMTPAHRSGLRDVRVARRPLRSRCRAHGTRHENGRTVRRGARGHARTSAWPMVQTYVAT